MLTTLSNVCRFFVIDLPGKVWVAASNAFGKWWYSHYH
jgi:hypothetical protein